MEGFRLHIKPLKNIIWHLKVISLFPNFSKKCSKDPIVQSFLDAFSHILESITNYSFFECPSPFRQRPTPDNNKSYIIRLVRNELLVKTDFSSVKYPLYYLAPARELKNFSDFCSFWCCLPERSRSPQHIVSRVWLPRTVGWRTRRRHTPHQEPPSISRAVVACGEL